MSQQKQEGCTANLHLLSLENAGLRLTLVVEHNDGGTAYGLGYIGSTKTSLIAGTSRERQSAAKTRKRNVQRLSRKGVHHKRLMVETGSPQFEVKI